jgi:hypothetical protein
MCQTEGVLAVLHKESKNFASMAAPPLRHAVADSGVARPRAGVVT